MRHGTYRQGEFLGLKDVGLILIDVLPQILRCDLMTGPPVMFIRATAKLASTERLYSRFATCKYTF